MRRCKMEKLIFVITILVIFALILGAILGIIAGIFEDKWWLLERKVIRIINKKIKIEETLIEIFKKRVNIGIVICPICNKTGITDICIECNSDGKCKICRGEKHYKIIENKNESCESCAGTGYRNTGPMAPPSIAGEYPDYVTWENSSHGEEIRCEICNGSGNNFSSIEREVECSYCRATGVCPNCNGTGIAKEDCKHCNKTGLIAKASFRE